MTVRQKKSLADTREIIRQMQEEYWRGLEGGREETSGPLRDILVFRLGGERFGIAGGAAREVLRIPRIVRVPMVSGSIRGIINLRGEVVAVSDLRPFLGLDAPDPGLAGRLIVVGGAGLTTALLVEKVEGLARIPEGEIEPLTEGLAGLPREAAVGQVSGGDELLVLLDLDFLLAQNEFIIDHDRE